MITHKIAFFLLLALSGLQAAAHELAAAGGPEVSELAQAYAQEIRLAKVGVSPQTLRGSSTNPPAASFNVRRYLTRRKEESAWRPVRREWGYFACSSVTRLDELPRIEGLAPGSRFSLVPYILDRDCDLDRGPPSS